MALDKITTGIIADDAVTNAKLATPFQNTISASDPAVSTNPSATGHIWFNKTTGESYVCTDATAGANVWKNTKGVGQIGPAYTLSWLVIAGGGSGGGYYRSGGGGAGGYRNSFNSETSGKNSSSETAWSITPGTVVTVVVGAGGAMAQTDDYATTATNGANGSASSITAGSSLVAGTSPISSTGGGGGGTYSGNGEAGGSGGGCGHKSDSSHTGGSGTANQGYEGGDSDSNGICGGSGGGAGEAGSDGGSSTNKQRFGGKGLPSFITGFEVWRAGGGGAGNYSTPAPDVAFGGLGGGGHGGGGGGSNWGHHAMYRIRYGENTTSTTYYLPTDGEPYTGSGGGGTSGSTAGSVHGRKQGNGGSGVVILRMATSSYSGTHTGSPIITEVGTDTVLQFIGNGTYTA